MTMTNCHLKIVSKVVDNPDPNESFPLFLVNVSFHCPGLLWSSCSNGHSNECVDCNSWGRHLGREAAGRPGASGETKSAVVGG